jgi:hypothetical protein
MDSRDTDTKKGAYSSPHGRYGHGQSSWSGQMDTAHVHDTYRPDGGPPGYRTSGRGGPGHNSNRGRSRSQKGYKRLWDHVKSVGRGDTPDTDGGM